MTRSVIVLAIMSLCLKTDNRQSLLFLKRVQGCGRGRELAKNKKPTLTPANKRLELKLKYVKKTSISSIGIIAQSYHHALSKLWGFGTRLNNWDTDKSLSFVWSWFQKNWACSSELFSDNKVWVWVKKLNIRVITHPY